MSRRPAVARSIRRLMRRHGLGSIARLFLRVETDEALAEELITRMTVCETYFFRHPEQFDTIGRTILPALSAARPPDAPIRMWSAGCCTGEEAYSLAILMRELGMADRARIIATDISTVALRVAAEARYGPRSFRGEAAARVMPHSLPEGRHLRLDGHLRRSVRFDRLALGTDPVPSADREICDLDLILCRNVLIYLRPDVVRHLARQFHDALADGGWLLLGPSDPPLWDHAPFVTYTTPAGILYRKEANALGRPRGFGAKVEIFGEDGAGAIRRERADRRDERISGVRSRLRQASDTLSDSRATERIHTLWRQGDTKAASAFAAEAVRRFPASARLRYMHGLLLIQEGRLREARTALRHLLYLDGSSAAAHFLLGICLRRSDRPAALQAFETAFAICARRPQDESVAFMSGQTAGRLALRIRREIASLKKPGEAGL